MRWQNREIELPEHFCPRCGRPFPPPDDDEAADWLILGDGDLMCRGCATPARSVTEER